MTLRILIADDAPYIREIIKNILIDEDVKFTEDAVDGEEAINHALRFKPDFIFMDLALPKKNGITACEAILKEKPLTSIVAVSSLHDADMIQKALEVGCMDFIKKPFEVNEILQAVEQARRQVKEHAHG